MKARRSRRRRSPRSRTSRRARLRRLLEHYGDPPTALRAVLAGTAAAAVRGRGVTRRNSRVGVATVFADPDVSGSALQRRGTHVWIDGDDDFPFARPVDTPPCVLFGEGARPDAFDRPRVAIVGTRSATPHGLADARELGTHVGRAGVTVVSGLAIGIDGAAHEGALDAGGLVVGVVATGLDVEYPRRHRALYRRVREQGVVVSEHWYGMRPDRARFPVRNRIIAALSDVVAVVEATQTGGARITAKYAADYGRPVFALPGLAAQPRRDGVQRVAARRRVAVTAARRRHRRLGTRARRPGAVAASPTAHGFGPRDRGAPRLRRRPCDGRRPDRAHLVGARRRHQRRPGTRTRRPRQPPPRPAVAGMRPHEARRRSSGAGHAVQTPPS